MKVVKLVLIKGLVLPFMAYLLQCVQSSDLTEDFASEFTTTTTVSYTHLTLPTTPYV